MVLPKNLDELTRRVFLKRGATLASVAPFVINLAACASSRDHTTHKQTMMRSRQVCWSRCKTSRVRGPRA